MTQPAFLEAPPIAETVTAYDEEHLVTYLRLLDAATEGADWREVASVVFGLKLGTRSMNMNLYRVFGIVLLERVQPVAELRLRDHPLW